jgi:GT2 family glycosyltransferase
MPAAGNRTVSVVIPIGRADDEFHVQLDAVRAQQGANLTEIVLAVNDRADGAVAAVQRATDAMGDPRIRVVDTTAAAGAAHARNGGAAAATGEVLAFCDADDQVSAGWLAALVDGLDRADAVGGRLDEMAGVSSHHRPPATPEGLPTFLGVPYIVSANLAMARSVFVEVGGFDEALHRGEDIALSWALIVAGHTLGYVDGAPVAYRPRNGSIAVFRQHFAYGRGMAQVLCRYGVPENGEWKRLHGRELLAPNGQGGGSGGLFSFTRRASLASGRVVGVIAEAVHRDRAA